MTRMTDKIQCKMFSVYPEYEEMTSRDVVRIKYLLIFVINISYRHYLIVIYIEFISHSAFRLFLFLFLLQILFLFFILFYLSLPHHFFLPVPVPVFVPVPVSTHTYLPNFLILQDNVILSFLTYLSYL